MTEKNINLDSQVNHLIKALKKQDMEDINSTSSQSSEQFSQSLSSFSAILKNLVEDPKTAIGTEFGQWEIIDTLGTGGMSVVYLVKRTEGHIDQQAALKIIPTAIASKNMVERFVRERQILSDLNHVNIAKLYDAGMSDQNIPWLVMELIQGQDILTYAHSHQLNIEQRVILFKQVCNALDYAHGHGVIHRDIKPSNLLVDQDNIVKLLDFGIASVDEQKSLTMTGAIIGTPGYMSPEQTKGLTNQLDRRSDIFSMGVLLYKLIKNTMPFTADSISEISYKIIHDEPSLMGSEIPTDLQSITYKCLEKQAENRYKSVKNLSKDLEAYLNGDVVSAHKVTSLARFGKKIKKHPLISSIVLLATTLSVLGLGYGAYQAYYSLNNLRLAENYLFRSQEIKSKVRRTHMMPLHDVKTEYKEYIEEIENLKIEITAAHADVSGLSHFALGNAYLSMRQYDLAYKYFIQAEKKGWKSPELSSALGIVLANKWGSVQKHALSIKGKVEKQNYIKENKTNIYKPALSYLKQAQTGKTSSDYIAAHLAKIESNYDEALAYLEKEISINPWHYEAYVLAASIFDQKAIKVLNNQGYTQAKHLLKASKNYMDKAIEIGKSDPLNYSELCSEYAFEIQVQLNYQSDKVEQSFNEGLKVCKNAMELAISPKPASLFHNTATLYSEFAELKNLKKQNGLPLYKKSLEIINQGLKIHPRNDNLLTASISPLIAMGKRDNDMNDNPKQYYFLALKNIKLSIEINPENRKTWHRQAILQKDMGVYYANSDDRINADKYFDQSITSHKKVIELGNKVSGYANSALVYYERAKLNVKAGEFDQGFKFFEQSIKMSEEIFKFNNQIFAVYNNYYEFQFEQVKALKAHNHPYKDELLKVIKTINQGCQFDYLQEHQISQLAQTIEWFYEEKLATVQDFKDCKL